MASSLLSSSAAGKVQESYCYQIFLEQNNNLVLPTVQQLLEHSFHSAGLKLAEVSFSFSTLCVHCSVKCKFWFCEGAHVCFLFSK